MKKSEKFQKCMRDITLDFKTCFLLFNYFSTIEKPDIKNTKNIHSIRYIANFIDIIIIKGNCFITIL